jgi:beta-lactamase class A
MKTIERISQTPTNKRRAFSGNVMDLAKRVERELTSYNGHMAMYVRDFAGNTVTLHEEELFETASTIKSFILLDLFEQDKEGSKDLEELLEYRQEHQVDGSGVLHYMKPGFSMSARNVAVLMIIVSDNTATNMLIEYLGLDHINETIQKYGFKDTVLHNHIDWQKYENLGTSTVKDYGEFFYRLHEGDLVSEEACQDMISIFKDQHYNSMLVGEFPQYYLSGDDCVVADDEMITVASKSGSMDACRTDGGIVYTPKGDYVIALFHKEFHDPLYHPKHEATLYGAKVSRLILERFLALEGKLVKETP